MTAILEKALKKLSPKQNKKISILRHLCQLVPPQPITSKELHNQYIKILEKVMDAATDTKNKDEKEALIEYGSMIASFLEDYEKKAFPIKSNSRDVLEFLMDQHNLNQNDLSKELGGQPVVSEILNGQRKLNAQQIQKLSVRFHVSPASFYPL